MCLYTTSFLGKCQNQVHTSLPCVFHLVIFLDDHSTAKCGAPPSYDSWMVYEQSHINLAGTSTGDAQTVAATDKVAEIPVMQAH